MKNKIKFRTFFSIAVAVLTVSCASHLESKKNVLVSVWVTKSDQSESLQKQANELFFLNKEARNPIIEVDDSKIFQTVEGFGFTLTGGSAAAINKLDKSKKTALLEELFSTKNNGIGISYLRISIGASDLNETVFSYNDLPEGKTDLELKHFNLGPDATTVVPLLQEIIRINSKIKIMGSPWSPPVWMKDNGSSKGGSLQPQYYQVYADYFVKYIQEMKRLGITIDAITPQNEPLHPGNNPSMYMSAEQQRDFIKNNLGPSFTDAKIKTKIIIYDHNCNKPEYPLTILDDEKARSFVTGSAFHLYEGDITALSKVHDAYPDKGVYFTEQYTGSGSDFATDLQWSIKNVIIGSMRNWSRNALSWGLANDEFYKPFTAGGCSTCKGGLMIDRNGKITREVGYYIIAHASKFVPEGSTRIESNLLENLPNIAFKTPSGRTVLIILNDSKKRKVIDIKYKNKCATTHLDAGAVATYVW